MTKAIVPMSTDMALFRQFLRSEMMRCARSGHADPVIIRYRDLARAGRLDETEAQEYAGLFNRMYSRWRWRQATTQALARKRMSQSQIERVSAKRRSADLSSTFSRGDLHRSNR